MHDGNNVLVVQRKTVTNTMRHNY